MKIIANSIVSLRYIMKNSRGEILENSISGEPVQYLHNTKNILPELQLKLEGLNAGSVRAVTLLKDTNPGLDDDLFFNIIIDDVREASPDEIIAGKPLEKKTTKDCGSDCCF